MEYWEDRNCSEAYLFIIDARQRALESFQATDDLDLFQERINGLDDQANELKPEDFGLSNGDYFVSLIGDIRHLFKIEDDVLKQHSTNDVWHKLTTSATNLETAMSMTRKAKWMRFREAPLGR